MDDPLLSPHDLGTDTPRREQPVGNAGKTHVLISKSTFQKKLIGRQTDTQVVTFTINLVKK